MALGRGVKLGSRDNGGGQSFQDILGTMVLGNWAGVGMGGLSVPQQPSWSGPAAFQPQHWLNFLIVNLWESLCPNPLM